MIFIATQGAFLSGFFYWLFLDVTPQIWHWTRRVWH